MTTNNITTLLDLIAEGNSSPKEFLQKIDPYQLSRIIYPRFHGTPDHVLCKGLPIQSGDVNGISLDLIYTARRKDYNRHRGNSYFRVW